MTVTPSRVESRSADEPLVIDDIPDGGYGWVVVFACSTITYVLSGPMHLITDTSRLSVSSMSVSPTLGE